MMAAAMMAVGFTACEEKTPEFPTSPSLTIIDEDGNNAPDNYKLSAGKDGETFNIGVSGTRDWSISKPQNAGWLTIAPTSGPKDKITPVKVTVAKNDDVMREAVVTVRAADGSVSKTFTVSQDGDTPQVDSKPIAEFRSENMAAIEAATDNTIETTENYVFAGTVISDAAAANVVDFAFTVQDDTEPNSGVVFTLTGHGRSLGEYVKVTVDKGRKAKLFNGMLQIEATSVEKLASGSSPTPIDIAIADISKYESQLVKIDEVQSVDDADMNWGGGTNGNIPFENKDSEGFNVYVRSQASFASTKLSTGSGYIIGLAGNYKGASQISPRNADDLKFLTGTRFGGSVEDAEPISLSDLRAKFTDSEVTITDNLKVTATVVNNSDPTTGGNNPSPKNIVISDGVAGITVRLTDNPDPANHYAAGDEVTLALKGLKMSKYDDLLQIAAANSKLTKTGKTNTIEPKSITATELLSGDYQSMLVSVKEVQFTSDIMGDKVSDYGTEKSIPAYLPIESSDKKEFIVYVSGYAGFFKTQVIPEKSGTMTGIATVAKAGTTGDPVVQLMPRTSADFSAMTADRFGETPRFGVSSEALKVPAAGGEAKVEVTGNVAWTASVTEGVDNLVSNPGAITGTGTKDIVLNFKANADETNTKVVKIKVETEADVETKSFVVVFTQNKYVEPITSGLLDNTTITALKKVTYAASGTQSVAAADNSKWELTSYSVADDKSTFFQIRPTEPSIITSPLLTNPVKKVTVKCRQGSKSSNLGVYDAASGELIVNKTDIPQTSKDGDEEEYVIDLSSNTTSTQVMIKTAAATFYIYSVKVE